MRSLFLILLLFLLANLTACSDETAGSDARRFCDRGVQYIETANGVTVAYNPVVYDYNFNIGLNYHF